jgi:hypothetical protein
LKAGQEDYWIRQIAQSGCEYQRPGVSPRPLVRRPRRCRGPCRHRHRRAVPRDVRGQRPGHRPAARPPDRRGRPTAAPAPATVGKPGLRPTPTWSPSGRRWAGSWPGGGGPTPARLSLIRRPTWSRSSARSPLSARRGRRGAWRPARSTATGAPTACPGSGWLNMCGAGAAGERDGWPTRGRGWVPRRQPSGRGRQVERDDRLAELLGPEPTGDLRQRRAWQAARTAVARLRERTHVRDDREGEAG